MRVRKCLMLALMIFVVGCNKFNDEKATFALYNDSLHTIVYTVSGKSVYRLGPNEWTSHVVKINVPTSLTGPSTDDQTIRVSVVVFDETAQDQSDMRYCTSGAKLTTNVQYEFRPTAKSGTLTCGGTRGGVK